MKVVVWLVLITAVIVFLFVEFGTGAFPIILGLAIGAGLAFVVGIHRYNRMVARRSQRFPPG